MGTTTLKALRFIGQLSGCSDPQSHMVLGLECFKLSGYSDPQGFTLYRLTKWVLQPRMPARMPARIFSLALEDQKLDSVIKKSS